MKSAGCQTPTKVSADTVAKNHYLHPHQHQQSAMVRFSQAQPTVAGKGKQANHQNEQPTSSGYVFCEAQVKEDTYSLLERKLGSLEYDSASCKSLCYQVASDILVKLNLNNDCDYKLVVIVTIGSSDYLQPDRKDMDLQIASRCLWKDDEDKFVHVVYQNSSLFTVVLLYAFRFRSD